MNHNSRINRLTGFEKKKGFLEILQLVLCIALLNIIFFPVTLRTVECFVQNLIITLNVDNDIFHQKINVLRNTKCSDSETFMRIKYLLL